MARRSAPPGATGVTAAGSSVGIASSEAWRRSANQPLPIVTAANPGQTSPSLNYLGVAVRDVLERHSTTGVDPKVGQG